MRTVIEKAAVLHEALPYIRRFHGKTFVIKYGGAAMTEASLREGFARDVVLMKYVGINPVVVHGGGPQIDEHLSRLGIETKRIEGLRVTDDATMEVVEMVLAGKINKEIVSLIGRHGGRAVGLSGMDDSLVLAEKLPSVQTRAGALVDLGRVGNVERVRPDVLHSLIQAGVIPVVAPIGISAQGCSLNINADTVAGAIAAAMGADKLVLMTDTAGVCDAHGKLINSLTLDESQRLRRDGVISGGMIPKVECALEAIAGGVHKCHIIDGRQQHAILLEIFTDQGIGTQIVQGSSPARVTG
jgi:acetylglutamate kinase